MGRICGVSRYRGVLRSIARERSFSHYREDEITAGENIGLIRFVAASSLLLLLPFETHPSLALNYTLTQARAHPPHALPDTQDRMDPAAAPAPPAAAADRPAERPSGVLKVQQHRRHQTPALSPRLTHGSWLFALLRMGGCIGAPKLATSSCGRSAGAS